ncbi:hypothetical protein M970_010650 [Encephalitozoon cuniculi EcunIII-L]|uniref:Spore wall and anchoring disk complex protein EnP1 n=1 Tax=Encephalitozoon cuniculi TaxID=6035 RepID=M1K4Y9_ENCCN|nr:hypothetical protein ECU01_0820 [Encephalitozoon cuniculi]KMV66735.1 hypothetical protein M970_010650 [Encephalitozoon cuniculi EcunIII-L]UYI28451.1 spore wall and anchoring disk complex protein EnP1 [Encephalitozoon cuniculi]
MKLLGFLIVGLSAISALKTKALHLTCEQELRPYSAVVDANCMAFALNGSNIHEAIKYLQAMNIKKAYVLYWNDHDLRGTPMVLYDNGALAPFDPYTNTAKYVLCVEACPCPGSKAASVGGFQAATSSEKIYVEGSARPAPCSEVCIEPVERRPHYKKIVVNPSPSNCIPCEPECYDSSSSSECNKKRCKTFPRICKEKCGSRRRGCPRKVEVLKSQKTYTFDIEKYRRRGEVVVRVCSKDSKEKFERFILSRNGEIRGNNNKNCILEPLPKCLRCPGQLHKLKKHIERKVCQEVCMYINAKCDIFVLVGDCDFYRVVVNDRRRYRNLHLKKVRGHKLRELIKHGLFGVEFGPLDLDR